MRPLMMALMVGLPQLVGAPGCSGEESPRMPSQTEAFALVRRHLLGVMPPSVLVEPDVRWWTEPCPNTDLSAVILGGHCYAGIYYRRGGIDVAWRGSIGRSAYSHELMHFFLDESGAGSDPLHLTGPMWEMVNQIDSALQKENL